MKIVFVAILIHSFAISAEADANCRTCPWHTPQVPQLPCECGKRYYDRTTKQCVPLLSCSISETTTDLSSYLPSLDRIADIFSSIVASASRGEREKESADVAKLLSFPLVARAFLFLGPKAGALVRTAVADNIERTVDRTLPELRSIFNPYVMANKGLLKKCGGSRVCMIGKLLGTEESEQKMNVLAGFVRDWIDGMIATVKDVAEAEKKSCGVSECDSLRTFIRQRFLVLELLTNMKLYDRVIADRIIKLFAVLAKVDDSSSHKNTGLEMNA